MTTGRTPIEFPFALSGPPAADQAPTPLRRRQPRGGIRVWVRAAGWACVIGLLLHGMAGLLLDFLMWLGNSADPLTRDLATALFLAGYLLHCALLLGAVVLALGLCAEESLHRLAHQRWRIGTERP